MEGGAEAGNYKGVMLCNRPMEANSAAARPNLNMQGDAPRFRPVGLPSEQIGLNPAKENVVCNVLAMEKEAARRRAANPSEGSQDTNFLVKHRRWLADIAKKKAALNDELQVPARPQQHRLRRAQVSLLNPCSSILCPFLLVR